MRPAPGTQIVGNTIGFRSPPNTVGNGLSGIHLGVRHQHDHRRRHAGRDQPDLAERPQRRDGARPAPATGSTATTASPTTRSWASISATTASRRTTPATATPGANNLQNFPVLTGDGRRRAGHAQQPGELAASRFSSSRTRPATRRATAKGETFLGAVQCQHGRQRQRGSFRCSPRPPARSSRATATSSAGDTSEFSAVRDRAGRGADGRPDADDDRLGRSGRRSARRSTTSLTAQNLGPQPAVGVQITDTLPAGLTATSAVGARRAPAQSAAEPVTCNIGTLGVDATAPPRRLPSPAASRAR